MADLPLTAQISKGKIRGKSSFSLLTRTSLKPKDKDEDESIFFKSIPTKDDLFSVLEAVSTALVDPARESYGLKGLSQFSISKIVFHPKHCRWEIDLSYRIDEVNEEKRVISTSKGSFEVELQIFRVSPGTDSGYGTFLAVDMTSFISKMSNEVLISRKKIFDLLKHNVARELYKLYLPNEFPEGCKSQSFRSAYQLNSKIKSGSFATVCIGTHRATRKRVAIKCTLRKKIEPYDDAVVYNEVAILSTLKHKYIAPINDFFVQDDCYFMVMDYMAGGDLFDRLGKKTTYSENDARNLVKNLLEAVAFLHDNNIAHCDLKHNNLLLVSKDDDSYVKLADFGFAARMYAPDSLSEQCGTPYFVAPEIVLRNPFGEKSDMWSVGVIIYCLLCGRVPFNGRRNVDLFRAVVNCEYSFDEEWNNVSDDAKDLIKRLLLTDPSRRLSAREALNSSWIEDLSIQYLKGRCLSNASKNLSVFNARQKLKSIILTTQCAIAISSVIKNKKYNLLVHPKDVEDADVDVDYASDAE